MPETRTLTCEEVSAQIFALVDCESCEEARTLIDSGEADGPSQEIRELMARHIAMCPHCQDALHAERHVRELLRRCYEIEVPARLRTTIVRRISEVTVRGIDA